MNAATTCPTCGQEQEPDPEPRGSCSYCAEYIWLDVVRHPAFPGAVFHVGCDLWAARKTLACCGVGSVFYEGSDIDVQLWHMLTRNPPAPAYEKTEER